MKRILAMLLLASLPVPGADDFQRSYEAAQRAMENGLWDVAALRWEDAGAAKDAPAERLPELRIRLAESLIRSNRTAEALVLLEESAVRSHPEAPFWIGQALAGQGRFAEAAGALDAVAADPSMAFREEAAFTSASLRLSLSQPDEAIRTLSLIDSVESRLRRIAILLDRGDTESARSLFPDAAGIPKRLGGFATLLEAHLLLAEGKAAEAEPLFSSLLSAPEGQDPQRFNQAVLGKADCQAAQGQKDAAIETLFSSIQSRPEIALLAPMFQRITGWLPDSLPSDKHPILERLLEWMPRSQPTGTGFVNTEANSAASAWPMAAQPTSDLEVFSLHARAIGLRRVGSPEAVSEAYAMLLRLRSLAPRHFLAAESLLTLARWKHQDGDRETAFQLLDTLRREAKSPLVRGEAAFRNAWEAFQTGDLELSAQLFDEASGLLTGENRSAAALNAALSKLRSDPSAPITIQATDPDVSEKLSAELKLERALAEESPEKAKAALDEFLIENPAHARSQEARLAAAEAALASAPPDLSNARAQLDTLASGTELPLALNPRLQLARLRLSDLSGDGPATIALANQMIAAFPGTPVASEAALTLGKNLFHAGNYNEARLALEKLASSEPGTQRSQAAFLLAARSAALGATSQSREEALELYDKAMQIKGPLESLALVEKARLLIDLNRLPAAIDSLSASYSKLPPDDPSRLSTGLLLAEAIYARGDEHPESLSSALAIYDELLALSEGSPARQFRIQYLRGLALEKLPDPDDPSRTRMTEAREAYFSVIDRPADPPPAEWEWFERSGFRLLTLLEADQDWKAAIAIAGKIASFGGPRAEEAATRARQLRLKHMVYDE